MAMLASLVTHTVVSLKGALAGLHIGFGPVPEGLLCLRRGIQILLQPGPKEREAGGGAEVTGLQFACGLNVVGAPAQRCWSGHMRAQGRARAEPARGGMHGAGHDACMHGGLWTDSAWHRACRQAGNRGTSLPSSPAPPPPHPPPGAPSPSADRTAAAPGWSTCLAAPVTAAHICCSQAAQSAGRGGAGAPSSHASLPILGQSQPGSVWAAAGPWGRAAAERGMAARGR